MATKHTKKNTTPSPLRSTRKNKLETKRTTKIVSKLMEMLNTIKLYHWQTKVYSQHKATDELYSVLSENVDTFVEVLLGKTENRILFDKKCIFYGINHSDTETIQKKMFQYRMFLLELDTEFDNKRDSDLLNVRDEMLSHLNQFLYLLSFD
jgi:hypothetical protein